MKTPVKKEAAKAAIKQDEVKALETKAVEAKAVEVAPVVETPVSAPKAEKEPKAKKAAAPKAEKAPKAPKTEKEPKAEKTAGLKTTVYVEFRGRQVLEEDLVAAVKRAWVGAGKKATDLKTLELYVKPEDGAVYYVINGENNGQVAF